MEGWGRGLENCVHRPPDKYPQTQREGVRMKRGVHSRAG